MDRYYYFDKISDFKKSSTEEILGLLTLNSEFSVELTQRNAWIQEINILKDILIAYDGSIFFEYSIPRMGRRIDVVLIIKNVLFVLEFKVGEKEFLMSAVDQVWDYALDLKNFHETSHDVFIAPVLVATSAPDFPLSISFMNHHDNLLVPIRSNILSLKEVIKAVLLFSDGDEIDETKWSAGRYAPTPTIIEAATALYNGHKVEDISKTDASATNLSDTSDAISSIITKARENKEKTICFVTGVPGAGKTLVGLNIATKHFDKDSKSASVFLSGNGPLVAVLREALTRDRVSREKERGKKVTKGEILRQVKVFIQNVHHFRDECLIDSSSPPLDHVAIFDEAQRAWDHTQTAAFMKRKKGVNEFTISEPEFLISCLNRHTDWAVIVCLVGGGQEINTGEAGISEWIESLNRSFPDWHVYISNNLSDSEYAAGKAIDLLRSHRNVFQRDELHLSVSLRSFRAEKLSLLIKLLLDESIEPAQACYNDIKANYPICISRNFKASKKWLKDQARGNERYGMIVSSQAQRLKPHAVDVKSPMDPIHWFLDDKQDVRSSFYLEDVATEFHVQGLELDWACVAWDADFRYTDKGWEYFSFVGDKWNRILKDQRKKYLMNAYRVLLTRSRQGMVIVVPEGDQEDHTRNTKFYDPTFDYLKKIGFSQI